MCLCLCGDRDFANGACSCWFVRVRKMRAALPSVCVSEFLSTSECFPLCVFVCDSGGGW